ncbi:sirohydrochlorin chelatase [Aeromicrobium sp. Leaf350]|uniref:sirohydrochlorin chelatase n=1 Tax=Aeromicrobium sp. Leaf350 TaxID=2876565 RepID=UPI001E426AE2|nr:hypothetical protein [Aeromicrobium sp. Leaf350]
MSRVLIVGSAGTHSAEGRANVSRLINAVRREAHGLDVADGYVDQQSPALAEVVRTTAGPRAIVPLLLTRDPLPLRAMVAAARLDPSVSVTAPIGPDWVLAEIGVQRLMEAGARPEDTIVLAADAVTDEAALEDVSKAARLLSAVWGGRVHVGTLGGLDADLGDAIDVARAYGKRVVVSSYVLTSGSAHDQMQLSGADVVTSPLVPPGAPDQRLVGLVLARARSRSGWITADDGEHRAAHG